MILYGSSLSPFVRKVLAFAAEKGIDLKVVPVGPGDPNPDFRAASPFGKMPAFSDGDFHLADSSAIVHYLEAKHPEPALIPAEPKLRGRTIWFDEFGDTIIAACGAKMFFNRVVAPRFLNRPGDEAAAATAEREELPPILDYLETVVPDGDGYLVGDRLTLADIAVASPFANLGHLNCEIDRARHGRTRAYVERILARPSFAPWIERETAFLAREPA
ncbi:glutathione S-transferase family protein [Sphingomonas sp.]|uniref:glutathione S-transferase family protein n=1 Tax=Sphingomonas sp. TaxID=28214 RepID=UPI00286C19E6|nr:glutathione S-transferase family protein [Sphingomonas sp.]